MQAQHLEVLEEDPAVAVHDRLGHAGRAGGVQHVQRMVGGDLLELDGPGCASEVAPGDRAGHRLVAEVLQRHRRLQAGEAVADRLHLGAAVDVAAAVSIAIDDEQHLRIDLAETVEHRLHAELGRAACPHRAEARGGQEGNDRLGDVRQVGGDAIAGADTEALQSCPRPADLVSQLVPRQSTTVGGSASGR